eukprot:Plantae.Rhodophyta-Purpureofilum_apyrenoidigerum.ctg33479.p1 GENE.Plantae.Rhodophyta-Purpureofilum_apyrenoidigerum.ctg33479~~Plantae.Rhodophyta-Purpureofilum_apyrenoidigerum.ctg33479.p1  ORF type:complete len:501 (+),score=76.61 Plantae.Rhodophyta-Purpureofilum_apyrenoidigerum.ctg33479:100-1503(+)
MELLENVRGQIDALWTALESLTDARLRGKRRAPAVPVKIVADNGLVVFRGEHGVYARKLDCEQSPDDEIFVMEETLDECAVSFGSENGREFLSARKSGIVEMDDDRSEATLWTIEDMPRGAMKLRNKSLGMYLRLEPSGKVSVQGNKIVHGTPLKVLHVLDWRSKRLRRNIVVISERDRRFATLRKDRLELNTVARQIQDKDIFELDYNPTTGLTNMQTSSGDKLTSSDGVVQTGQHGWFTTEKANNSFALRGPQGYVTVNSAGNITLTQNTRPGAGNMFLFAVPPTNPAEGEDDCEYCTSVDTLEGGVKLVKASISIPTDPNFPFQAVKDWNSLPNFVSKIAQSSRLQNSVNDPQLSSKYLVEMTQKHSFMFFKKFDKMTLEACEDQSKRTLETRVVSSGLLRVYNCLWLAEADSSNKAKSTLHLTVEFLPSIPIPGFIIDGLIQTDTAQTLNELRQECIRRAKRR